IYPACFAGAATRIVESAGCRLSYGARSLPLAAIQGIALRAVLVAGIDRRRPICGRSGLPARGLTPAARQSYRFEQSRLHVEHGGGEAVTVGKDFTHHRERRRPRGGNLAHDVREIEA